MDRGLMTVIGSYQVWPEGLTWVFQGTVAEDATAGTHICTLTVTPGVGNEMEVRYGSIILGNTATAQVPSVRITDGTNVITKLITGPSTTTANAEFYFPSPNATGGVASQNAGAAFPFIVSGTMTLVLLVSTAAVSVTQTFAVVCRIKGSAPTAVLNDTVGTSTNTTNTSKVFG